MASSSANSPENSEVEGELVAIEDIGIGRLILTDQERLLISSFYPPEHDPEETERAVLATGLANGVVVLIRRLVSSGLAPA